MASKLVVLVAVAAMAQVSSAQTIYKYSPSKEKHLVKVLFLNDFDTLLTTNFNETRECYREIQESYRTELKLFKNGVSIEIPYLEQFVLRDGDSFRLTAEKALIKLRKLAYLMLDFEHRLREYLENFKIDSSFAYYLAITEWKDSKRAAYEFFVEYEYYRQLFSQRPKGTNNYFISFLKAFNSVNKVFGIEKYYWVLRKCIKEKESNF